ncbi:hypothetical protein AKJ51_04615 [candidate division MSBL1 archaeon SCGC-AAA382A20]|uniref:Uncharacterized protein n=1 Tax=candidate division MSBL1 archaeon SCGC-AAA382A20 TaxID=1698280 RepID=A0A133VHG6_9EURY|nr:hypothetical protein AKJ51_04615 [candidate division MSBL1 archaeon SCGC-AAA382A20]
MADINDLKLYRKLYKKRKELKEKVSDLEEQMGEVEKQVLDYMVDNGISALNIEDNNIYIHRQLWASVPKSAEESDWEKLRNHPKFGRLIQNSINTHSLSSMLREERKNLEIDESIEDYLKSQGLDDVVSVYERESVRVRKSN